MPFADDRHPSDETVEQYSLGRLDGQKLDGFEEHLLICPTCQDRLARDDAWRAGMRDAAAVLPREPVAQRRFLKLFWALGFAILLLSVGAVTQSRFRRRPQSPPAVIMLQATRGAESSNLAAPAGKPLALSLDLTGLPQLRVYAVEVVDAAGNPVLRTGVAARGSRAPVALNNGLNAGAYFVRLYDPSRVLLREFVLTVRA